MNLIFMGPPGAGKGTQAAVVASQCGLTHISSGDLLRAAVKEQSDLGVIAKGFMERGELVPDALMIEMIMQPVMQANSSNGFILDGFPRTLAQAEALDRAFEQNGVVVHKVVHIHCADEVIVARLSGRRVCPLTNRVYHVIDNPPKVAGFSDADPSVALLQRDDDREDVIRRRLAVYRESTMPILEYYRSGRGVQDVDGLQPVSVITKQIVDLLQVE